MASSSLPARLDVGFGPGTITLDLAEAVAPGEVIGIENADAPFATCRKVGGASSDSASVLTPADYINPPRYIKQN